MAPNMNKILLTVICATVTVTAIAQEKTVFTTADYERAESMLSYNTGPLIDRADVRPNWVEGDRFWYRVLTATGSEYVLVDPSKKARTTYPDRERYL